MVPVYTYRSPIRGVREVDRTKLVRIVLDGDSSHLVLFIVGVNNTPPVGIIKCHNSIIPGFSAELIVLQPDQPGCFSLASSPFVSGEDLLCHHKLVLVNSDGTSEHSRLLTLPHTARPSRSVSPYRSLLRSVSSSGRHNLNLILQYPKTKIIKTPLKVSSACEQIYAALNIWVSL
ncbi:MAG: putative capsid protein [Circoviridae sp.]|nr:MAG: putative capsid protein [Circoviridae sp.]